MDKYGLHTGPDRRTRTSIIPHQCGRRQNHFDRGRCSSPLRGNSLFKQFRRLSLQVGNSTAGYRSAPILFDPKVLQSGQEPWTAPDIDHKFRKPGHYCPLRRISEDARGKKKVLHILCVACFATVSSWPGDKSHRSPAQILSISRLKC